MRTVLILLQLLVLAGSCLAVPPAQETVQSLAPPVVSSSANDDRSVLQFTSDNGRRRFLSEHNAAFKRLSAIVAGRSRPQGPDTFRLSQSTETLLIDGHQRAEVQRRLSELDTMLALEPSTATGQQPLSLDPAAEAVSTTEFRRRLAKFAAVGVKCDDCHARYTVVPR